MTANTATIGTTSAASSLTLGGVVTAATPLTLVGTGTLTATNAANNFSTVTATGAGNVSLRDANAITLNASTLTGALSVQAAGAVTVAGSRQLHGRGQCHRAGRQPVHQQCRCVGPVRTEWSLAGMVIQCDSVQRSDARQSQWTGLLIQAVRSDLWRDSGRPACGNGFLYSLAPTVTPGLAGTCSQDYDGTTTATLLPANFTAAGAVDGDSVSFTSTAANYVNRNVGVGKSVTATGLAAVASNGAATVYGYTPSSTSTTASIGTITPAALVVMAQADSRVYNGTTASSAAPVVTGTTYDAVGTAATQTFDNRNVGTGKTLTAGGLVMADGNGGANYAVSYVTNTQASSRLHPSP